MTDPKIIDGKEFAARLRKKIHQDVEAFKAVNGHTPGLAVVLVGDDPASHVYVRNKAQQTIEVGMESFEHRLPLDTSQQKLLDLIDNLNKDKKVNGILVQLPLPKQINPQAVLDRIDPAKDVDGFHVVNAGKLATGGKALIPCTPYGCLMLLKDRLGDLSGKRALILGRSNIVGKPMAQLLLNENCTVTIAHSRTRDLPEECRRADIIVAAIGKPEFVKGDWIKEGATVIDVGINRVTFENGKSRIVGDVDFKSAYERTSAITPVPGGVGPMTIAVLLKNTLEAAEQQNASI